MEATKERWVKAYKHTLKLYQTDKHLNDSSLCAKCKLTIKMANEITSDYRRCSLCPETAFSSYNGCVTRYTVAQDSKHLSPIKKEQIIEYHNRAIEFLNSMDEFDMVTVMEELINIDQSIKENYENIS
jgi:hypothetical protein